MKRPPEPGLIRLYRYVAFVAVLYFGLFSFYETFSPMARTPVLLMQVQVNLVLNAIIFLYLSIPWLEQKLKHNYLRIALAVHTLVTLGSTLLSFLSPESTLEQIYTRNWSVMPVLMALLVFVSWQYSFRTVILYTILVTLSDLILNFWVLKYINLNTLPFFSLPLLKAFVFGIVGNIIYELNVAQKAQKQKLLKANIQLGQYAVMQEKLAVSRERNRLARELHDTLAHTLSGTAVNLEAVKSMLPAEQAEIGRMLDNSLKDVRSGLDETRRVLHDLRAMPLEELGLGLALRNLFERTADRENLQLDLQIDPSLPELTPAEEQAFYRIGQESLDNIVHHALASKLWFSLRQETGGLTMRIRDNGQGFDPQQEWAMERYGLRGMRERATQIGADLRIESADKAGTTVTLLKEGPHG